MPSSHNNPLSDNNVDSIVLNAFKNNKFSSANFISAITHLHADLVSESVKRLAYKRRIYLSVGGLPKRYSHTDELMGWTDTEEEYQESKRSALLNIDV